MKKMLFAFGLFLTAQTGFSQDFTPPKLDKKLETQAEFEALEPEVLKCINWLNATPLSNDDEKRKQAYAFFMLWLTDTKKVSVIIDGYLLNFAEKNPDLLMAFMTGWSKLALENPNQSDKFKLALAGMKNVVNTYKNNMDFFKKDKKLKKLLEMDTKGELEDWLHQQLK